MPFNASHQCRSVDNGIIKWVQKIKWVRTSDQICLSTPNWHCHMMFFIALVGYLSCRWRLLQRRWQQLRPESLYFHVGSVRIPFHCECCQDAVPIRIKAPSIFGESPLLLGAPARPICFQQIFGHNFETGINFLKFTACFPMESVKLWQADCYGHCPGGGSYQLHLGIFEFCSCSLFRWKESLRFSYKRFEWMRFYLRSSCHWNRASHFHCIGFLNAFVKYFDPLFLAGHLRRADGPPAHLQPTVSSLLYPMLENLFNFVACDWHYVSSVKVDVL